MNTQRYAIPMIEELPERFVLDYLEQHPDFFTHHEELLTKMAIPHNRGTAISLVERQLAVLREENRHLQHKLDNLISAAQKNEQLNRRIQRLVIALSSVSSPDAFFDTLYDILQHEFETDAVIVRLFGLPGPALAGRQEFVEYDAQVFTLFEKVLETFKPVCGRLSPTQADYLFPRQPIVSGVLMPLGTPKPWGLLAMGSQDISRFHAGMATDLLQYMGELVSQLLRIWLRD
jgi:hypothetical protein